MKNVDFWLVLKNQMVWPHYRLDVLCSPFHVKEALFGFCLAIGSASITTCVLGTLFSKVRLTRTQPCDTTTVVQTTETATKWPAAGRSIH